MYFLSKLTYTKLSDESLNKCENIEYFYLENSIQLSYIISDNFWKANGPILFYASENVDANLICQQISPIWSQAEKLEALVVFAEQRKEKNNPIVLSSDQILANYKLLINHIKTKTPGAQQSSRIITINHKKIMSNTFMKFIEIIHEYSNTRSNSKVLLVLFLIYYIYLFHKIVLFL